MPEIKILNPDSLGKPLGQYSQITRVKTSEFLFIAGQVGELIQALKDYDKKQRLESV